MLTTKSNARIADLDAVRSDSLLKLIALANADPRTDKIDVGVGVYRDGQGRTPGMRGGRGAGEKVGETQDSKSYLGSAGDELFPELLKPTVLGPHASDARIVGVQTPGGCGAVRGGRAS